MFGEKKRLRSEASAALMLAATELLAEMDLAYTDDTSSRVQARLVKLLDEHRPNDDARGLMVKAGGTALGEVAYHLKCTMFLRGVAERMHPYMDPRQHGLTDISLQYMDDLLHEWMVAAVSPLRWYDRVLTPDGYHYFGIDEDLDEVSSRVHERFSALWLAVLRANVR